MIRRATEVSIMTAPIRTTCPPAERGRSAGTDWARRLRGAARTAHRRAARMREEAELLDDGMEPLRVALRRRASELELCDMVLEQTATGLDAAAPVPS